MVKTVNEKQGYEQNHTFVICAYKESPYLEECIQSLRAQTIQSNLLISTATPNQHITAIAEKYSLEVRVNTGDHGIAQDWNFALAQANSAYVTLAHQDDVYAPEYAEKVLKALKKADRPIIAFTDYFEVRNGENVFSDTSSLLKVKEKLLLPLRKNWGQKSCWMRRRVLSMGNAICCPSVTYVAKRLKKDPFTPGFKSNIDWQMWEQLSRQKGSFVYLHEPLMGHRVHAESTTTEVIGDGEGRTEEDRAMFRKFWPAPIAEALVRIYAKSQSSNQSI